MAVNQTLEQDEHADEEPRVRRRLGPAIAERLRLDVSPDEGDDRPPGQEDQDDDDRGDQEIALRGVRERRNRQHTGVVRPRLHLGHQHLQGRGERPRERGQAGAHAGRRTAGPTLLLRSLTLLASDTIRITDPTMMAAAIAERKPTCSPAKAQPSKSAITGFT